MVVTTNFDSNMTRRFIDKRDCQKLDKNVKEFMYIREN